VFGTVYSTTSETTPEPNPQDAINAVYASYHELLSSRIAEFGLGRRETDASNAPFIRGVIYAELIDFDNDGVPELLLIRGDEGMPASAVCYVYRYTMDGIELLESYGLYLNHAWISIVEASNGTSFLCYSGGDAFGIDDTYYTIVDGSWVEVLNRAHYENEIYDNNGYWLRDEFEWFVNGNSVNEQAYNNALESHLGIVTSSQISIFDDIFHIVHDVLAELKARIHALESGSKDVYIYQPPGESIVRPNDRDKITDSGSAEEIIKEVIDSLTEEQRKHGDTLDEVALFIENAVSRGVSQIEPGDVVLDSTKVADLTDVANGIMENAKSTLMRERIDMLRGLRTNISVRTNERERLHITIPDDVSDFGFGNITIDSDFVSVTVSSENAQAGNEIEIRNVEFDPGLEQPGQERRFNPLDYWSILVIALFAGVWGVLSIRGIKLRKWIVPTLCLIAVGINAVTYFTGSDDIYESGTKRERTTDAIELIMTDGMAATISLLVTENEKDSLLLLNANGIPQPGKYNPVTGMIDTRISESGVYTLREYTVSFTDIEQKDAMMRDAITRLASRNIITGTADGYFKPDDFITRAEFVSAATLVFDMLDPGAVSNYADVSRSDWYYEAVATAEGKRVLTGYEDNTFRGDSNIQKDHLTVIAANLMIEEMGYIVPSDIETPLSRYSDRSEIERWSENGVALATQSNILIYRKDGLFAPRSPMTRGDAAIILDRLFQNAW